MRGCLDRVFLQEDAQEGLALKHVVDRVLPLHDGEKCPVGRSVLVEEETASSGGLPELLPHRRQVHADFRGLRPPRARGPEARSARPGGPGLLGPRGSFLVGAWGVRRPGPGPWASGHRPGRALRPAAPVSAQPRSPAPRLPRSVPAASRAARVAISSVAFSAEQLHWVPNPT